MRILYVGMRYDYGIPERGLSFEHYNFYETLVSLGHEVIYFDFMTLLRQVGRQEMNERLWETVKSEAPDLLFSILFEEEVEKDVIRRVSRESNTITLNWFADDHWRFDTYSRHWAPCFNWVVTTAESAVPKYAAMKYGNVIKSQWGFNPFLYRKFDLPFRYDLSFVGQPHGNRRRVVTAGRAAGLSISTWGQGWEAGRLEQAEMIRVFNQSRINLNLSNASTAGASALPRWLVDARRWAGGLANRSGIGRALKRWRHEIVERVGPDRVYPDQVKARNFEIPGCGGFQLAGQAENLADYFVPEKEIVIFESTHELIDKARYYLDHEKERLAIAEAGYQRALRDHTYTRRFEEIFSRIGLQ